MLKYLPSLAELEKRVKDMAERHNDDDDAQEVCSILEAIILHLHRAP